MQNSTIHIPEVVGGGYRAFWTFRGRYRVVKGSRASKKSKTTALWYIYHMMKFPQANTLVVRKTFRTLKDSCYTELKWAAGRLQVEQLWRFTLVPLEATYLPTGQKIYFRGLDDPLKVTSITVEKGCLCWLWVEEAYELTSEKDFDTLDESIRGQVPLPLFKQVTLTFNPWNERHWLKKRFFDTPNREVLAITTNYTCNEWLDQADRRLFETMRKTNPRRYQVAGLGHWGIVDGLVYENWREEAFEPEAILGKGVETVFGLDFGYTNDPTALFCGILHREKGQLWVFDELYQKGLGNAKIAREIQEMGYGKERIVADSAEPKSIDQLRGLGLRIRPAAKGRDSVQNGIQFIQELEIVVHPRCVSFLTEISNYTWDKDKFGNVINRPIDNFNHLMDAMRYALEGYVVKGKWLY